MAIAKEKEETGPHEECINTAICTAIALQSIRLFQSLLYYNCSHCSLFSYYRTIIYFVAFLYIVLA